MDNKNSQRISEDHKLNLKVPVLMYHGVMDNFQDNLEVGHSPFYITIRQFQSQMRYLHENGYRTLNLNQLDDIFKKRRTLDDEVLCKLIIITFDDGYQNNYVYALPILKKFSFDATFFVVVNRIGTPNYMSWQQLKQMTKEGMEIQSHTLNHNPLEVLSRYDLEQELRLSKQILEKQLNRTVKFISYPHGSYNKKIIEIVKKVGYSGSFTSEINFFNPTSNPFEIGRIDIRRNHDLEDFIKIVQNDPAFIKKIKINKMVKKIIKKTIGIAKYNRLYKEIRKKV